MSHPQTSGVFSVVAALLGNTIVTILKFFGFFISGSSAMFSEAIHSTADTANQFLLLIGLRRSKKKATAKFVYGFGRERFLWALISACGVFFIGAGVTVYHGIAALFHGEGKELNPTTLIILLVAFIVESGTFLAAIKELFKHHKGQSLKHALKEGDPATIAVLYEDGVAVLGVVIAFLSIVLSHFTDWYAWDAIGSILIGLLLGAAAIVLIGKNRAFLIGKTMPEPLRKRIEEILVADPLIEKVLDFKSTTLDIGDYRIKCEVEFNGASLVDEIFHERVLKEEFKLAQKNYGEFLRFCVDYADRVPRLLGGKIDLLEKKIQEEVKGVSHIDIELN